MDKISIKIPANKKYQKSVRLFVAGLGSEMGFNIEQIELRDCHIRLISYSK